MEYLHPFRMPQTHQRGKGEVTAHATRDARRIGGLRDDAPGLAAARYFSEVNAAHPAVLSAGAAHA